MGVIILNSKRRFFSSLVIAYFGFFLVGCDFLNNISTIDSILTTEENTQTTQDSSITTDEMFPTTTDVSTTLPITTLDQTTSSFDTSQTTTTTITTTSTTTSTTTLAEYHIDFDTKGVTNVDSISYTLGESVTLSELSLADYIFYGWYYESDFTGDPVTEIPAGTSGDITMYAKLLDLSDLFLNNTENILVFPDSCLYVNNDETRIISEDLQDLYNAFIHLGFDNLDIEYFSVNDYLTLSNMIESGNLTEIFDSKILYATISKVIVDFFGSIVGIPYYSNQGELLIIHDAIDDLDYIKKDELFTFINSLEFLNIEVESFDFSLDFFSHENIETFLNSSIWHYFISNMAIDLENHGDISIPDYDFQADPVIISYGELDKTTVYISKPEIRALFEAMEALQITDLTTLTSNYDVSLLQNENDLDIILNSAIIHLSISENILELNDGNLLIIPKTYINQNPLIVSVGNEPNSSLYIDKAEIKALTAAMNALNINIISQFSGEISLNYLIDQVILDTILDSTIMHATISYRIIEFLEYDSLSKFYFDSSGNEIIISVGNESETIEYVSKNEIDNLINAFDILGLTGFSFFDFSNSIEFLSTEEFGLILNSHFLYYILSSQILNNFSDSNFDHLSTYFNLITYQDRDAEVSIMQKQDIIDFFNAVLLLDISNLIPSMIHLQLLQSMTQADLDIVLNSKVVKYYLTPTIEVLAASLNYTLTESDYEGSLTTNALTKTTIIVILDMLVE
jgi:uncharacterized repeat protein (TIGR02543 family)